MQVCGVDHRRYEGLCAIILVFLEVRMADCKNERKRELECLRLASDLTQLASETLNPDLRAHCLRMARKWTDQVAKGPISHIPLQSVAYH